MEMEEFSVTRKIEGTTSHAPSDTTRDILRSQETWKDVIAKVDELTGGKNTQVYSSYYMRLKRIGYVEFTSLIGTEWFVVTIKFDIDRTIKNRYLTLYIVPHIPATKYDMDIKPYLTIKEKVYGYFQRLMKTMEI
jgi:hypothetical protein